MLKPARPSVRLDGAPDQSAEEKRAEILAFFRDSWETYERLFTVMASEQAYYRRADPLRHPLVFYLGHTAVFFVNKLLLAGLIPGRVNPRFESIFAVGVDEMSWDDLDERLYDWPPVAEVFAYRNQVRAVIEETIARLPVPMPIGWDDPMWTILMGTEHERIHLETSSVLMRQLPLELVRPRPDWPICPDRGPAPAPGWTEVAGGPVRLGKERDHVLYGWDNEYGHRDVTVASFRAGTLLVSHAEFRAFMDDGGYTDERWWTGEGWVWRQFRQATHPLFWVRREDGGWNLRCLAEEIPLPDNWPVEVNQLEAKAFCNWKAARDGRPIRLPTEAEWYRLLDQVGLPDQPDRAAPPGNIELAGWASSTPVDAHLHGGIGDMLGNVWQWTETPISGFPGFAVHPLYDDFSTPTFDNKHNLMKGGSWISTGNEATRHSRYAFRRHFFQHAGFRYVDSEQPVDVRDDIYETDALVAQYCEFHYGETLFGVPNFAVRCAEICRELAGGRTLERALDLGCATGRASFEMARFCTHVTGIDFSARFIRVCHQLQENGSIRYAVPDEGELVSYRECTLAALGLDQVAGRVEFRQGDAHNLKPQHTGYDLVLAANLIDRLYDPARFIADIGARVRSGGLLVILSPYTWLEEFTPRDKWLGGRKVDGENLTTLAALRAQLAGTFDAVGEPRDVPFVIRETRRKHQHTVSQLTAWRRR
ncbi:MAG: 5-histidylcysteine sulfoxide synthase [bacterium]|nr:5-histidylcysteine sulfoxide synthase [bacterium]